MNHKFYSKEYKANTHKALGLGSNVGKREENLSRALEMLGGYGVHVIRESSVYETDPVGCVDDALFLNQVVFIETDLTPEECLVICMKVEAEIGRVRSYKNAPRLIDVDILLWGETVMNVAGLTVPHKCILSRKFVLVPLLEISDGPEILEWLVNVDQGPACVKIIERNQNE